MINQQLEVAFPELCRRTTSSEFRQAQRIAAHLGLGRLDERRPLQTLVRQFALR